jgi:hypothetical protein
MSLGCKETVMVWFLDMPTLEHLLGQSQAPRGGHFGSGR